MNNVFFFLLLTLNSITSFNLESIRKKTLLDKLMYSVKLYFLMQKTIYFIRSLERTLKTNLDVLKHLNKTCKTKLCVLNINSEF